MDDGPGGGWEEALMLALRLDTGISIQETRETYGVAPSPSLPAVLQKFKTAGLLAFDGDRLALTEKGFLVSNTVIGEIIAGLTVTP